MKKGWLGWSLGSAVYFLWFGGAVGLRIEHFVVWAAALFSWFWSETSRETLKNVSVWLFFWMLYDSLRVAPNWTVNAVHIRDLYDFDKKWFGVADASGQIRSLNEWCGLHQKLVFDFAAGAFYVSWVPLPVLFAAWLYWKNRPLYLRFSWCFFVVNVIGVAIYYLFPAAPPWYVAENGFAFDPNAAMSAAGLDRVDRALGIDLFHSIYTRNSNVFAAMPSLHSAYPLVSWLYASRTGRRWIAVLFAAASVGIWVSAIY